MEDKVLEFWNEQAKKYKDNPLATSPDLIAFELEANEIFKYLEAGSNILDIGCGNGFKDFEYCTVKKVNVKGIDFSEEMVNAAKERQKQTSDLMGKLEFSHGNVLDLKETIKYDVVITDRCLINLRTVEEQMKAIDNIFDVLKEGGLFLMMECTKQGLEKINGVREKFGLEEIKERWHNNYIDETKILAYLDTKFKNIEVNNFNSTFFLISRTINALAAREGQEVDYNSDINKYAAQLPPLGDYAPLKLFVIRK